MRNPQPELKRKLDTIQSTLDALHAYERKLYWNAQNSNTTEADTAETFECIRQAADNLTHEIAELKRSLSGEKGSKTALNQVVRVVDLGVAVCVDHIIKHAEVLQTEGLTPEQTVQHKAEIRKNATTYKQALDELISVLDEDTPSVAKNGTEQPPCALLESFKAYPHLEPLSIVEEKSLDDKLNLFHSLLSTFSTFPEMVQILEIHNADRLSVGDVAEVYKVYGAYLSKQFSHLHRFAQDNFDVKKGGREC